MKSSRRIGSERHEAARDRGGCRHQHGRHAGADDDRPPRGRTGRRRTGPAPRGRRRGARPGSSGAGATRPLRARRAASQRTAIRTQKPRPAWPANAGRWTMIRAASTQPRNDEGRQDRRRDGRRSCGRTPMRRLTTRSARPTAATRTEARAAAANKRRPDLDRLAVIGPGQEPCAETGLGARRQLADDGSDEADGDRDLQAREEVTAARRAGAASRRSAPARPNRCA